MEAQKGLMTKHTIPPLSILHIRYNPNRKVAYPRRELIESSSDFTAGQVRLEFNFNFSTARCEAFVVYRVCRRGSEDCYIKIDAAVIVIGSDGRHGEYWYSAALARARKRSRN